MRAYIDSDKHEVLFTSSEARRWAGVKDRRATLAALMEQVSASCAYGAHHAPAGPLLEARSADFEEEYLAMWALQEHTEDGLRWVEEVGELVLRVDSDGTRGAQPNPDILGTGVPAEVVPLNPQARLAGLRYWTDKNHRMPKRTVELPC